MLWMWIGFLFLVFVLLALDLGVFNRGAHEVSAKRAMVFVLFFITLGGLFNVSVYFIYAQNWMGMGDTFAKLMMGAGEPGSNMPAPHQIGLTAAGQFLAGWLTEYSLSVDNLFVIALIFAYFKVPAKYQHRVLFWGILGALIARGVMIFAGTALVQRFEWLIYILGAFLVYTGFKLAFAGDSDNKDFNNMLVVRLARKIVPISPDFHGEHFLTRLPSGARAATPLLLVLLIVETTDVIFAVDSIPAIIGITRDPFIVFTSNVFAILGLRSLYFALAALMDKFHYLKYSLALILAFVGVKMLLEGVHHLPALYARFIAPVPDALAWLPTKPVHISTAVSLGVIGTSLALGVGASLLYAKRHSDEHAPPAGPNS
jgi:tellurite resistance protein TerC